jgi:hypothetical protein
MFYIYLEKGSITLSVLGNSDLEALGVVGLSPH